VSNQGPHIAAERGLAPIRGLGPRPQSGRRDPVVLLVEADLAQRRVVAAELRGSGLDVVEVADIQEAQALMRKGTRIDFVVSATKMPEGDRALRHVGALSLELPQA
jgi:CheY-like chemotaxis protein